MVFRVFKPTTIKKSTSLVTTAGNVVTNSPHLNPRESTTMDPNTEIRKLKPAVLWKLTRILALSNSWEKLLANVLKDGTENVYKFNTEHIRLIEEAARQQQKSGAEIFLEEWSTMGRQRPTLKSMLDLLVRAELFWAADYVAVNLLNQPKPERPTSGPAAEVYISDDELLNMCNTTSSLDSALNGMDYPSQLSAANAVQHREEQAQNETRLLQKECIERVSNLRISPSNEGYNNSNQIQFSESDVENPTENSDLIKFSTNTIPSSGATDFHENFPLANSAFNTHLNHGAQIILQKYNIAGASSPNNNGEYSVQQTIRKEYIPVQQSSESTSSTSTSGSRSVSYPDSRTTFELQTSELPVVLGCIERGPTYSRSELRSNELPQFVVEIAQQGSDQSEASGDAGSFGEPILLNGSSSSTSSNYLTNVTRSSYNNTESNIPSLHFDSQRLENTELASAELPQFVAALGHRQSQGNSTEIGDGGSELANESSNGVYTGQFVGDSNESSNQYLVLGSQELPLVISEGTERHRRLEEDLRELQSAELPIFVAQL